MFIRISSAFLVLFTLSCSLISGTLENKEAILLDPVTIQEDSWKFKYTSTELPGNQIDDGFDDQMSAAGQWAVINLSATNTSKKKQDIWTSSFELEEFILITSDGQKWEYPEQVYDYGINTVKSEQSFHLQLAYDIPNGTVPETLIYRHYDEDYNTLEFQISL